MQNIRSRTNLSLQAKQEAWKKMAHEQPPLRAELYGSEQMIKHVKMLANRHRVVSAPTMHLLQKRLAENEKTLMNARLKTSFLVIQEQIRKTKTLLLKIDYDLPALAGNSSKTIPRVYDIAAELIQHSNAQVEPANLIDFIAAYQSVSSLQTGELKAIGTMLKLALLENLRRAAVRMVVLRNAQQQAHEWSSRIVAATKQGNEQMNTVLEDLHRSGPPLRRTFAAELIKRLENKEFPVTDALEWIKEQLSGRGIDVSELISHANEEQAADKVSFRNSISSLRILDTIDWQNFVDVSSVVEPVLCRDCSGIYSQMNFYTRDGYRKEIGKVARQSGLSELEVAHWLVAMSRKKNVHTGFFLAGEGRKEFERSLGIHRASKNNFLGFARKHPLSVYLGGIIVVTIIAGLAFFALMYNDAVHPLILAFTALLILFPASQVAKQFIESLVGFFSKPVLLPRLDYSKGIPGESRTMVVVPALLTGEADIDEMIHALEIRFLGNRLTNLHFALLTDFTDASKQNMPNDQILIDRAIQKIEALNKKYDSTDNSLFFLFHRPRKWNAGEKLWMGYERKRGKLMELNAFLRDPAKTCFSAVVGNAAIFPAIKFIITLDADTQLPRDTAWKMVGTMAHPLNGAVYSEKKKRVISGYGMLQPRIGTDMRDFNNSWYHRINGGGPNIDPYTRTTPDVYQDLFLEGSFAGKGIYDVDLILKTIHDRFPENRILSHDLLEGSYVRSGLLNDVKLFEKTLNYRDDVRRKHRWIRGDWQIAAWVGPVVPGFNKKKEKNPLSALSRWKIFDNLRTSLVPPALLLLLIVSFAINANAWQATLFVFLLAQFPALNLFARKIVEKPKQIGSAKHWKYAFSESTSLFVQNLYSFMVLPYEAFISADAIVRTGWRMVISHRKLLEWIPSGTMHNKRTESLAEKFITMWISPLTALAFAGLLLEFEPLSLAWLSPVLLLWIMAPAIVYVMNRPRKVKDSIVNTEQQVFLRKTARKTWAYFERFVTVEGNWLPPDHYQEYPEQKQADYTSPTNIGLALLSNLSALDFGYISEGRLLERTERTMSTMQCLERFHGHFFNWYLTRFLKPCLPIYVSTVDSGNLAGHLLTLRQGLLSLPGNRMTSRVIFDGLRDTFLLLKEALPFLQLPQSEKIDAVLNKGTGAKSPAEINFYIEEVLKYAKDLKTMFHFEEDSDPDFWLTALEMQCCDLREEVLLLAPWLQVPLPPPAYTHLVRQQTFTLAELAAIELPKEGGAWIDAYTKALARSRQVAKERMIMVDQLEKLCDNFASMEYDFLYNHSEKLLSIGYQVEAGCQDTDCYDVLASEARLASFVAIAQGRLPTKSWFTTSRTLVQTEDDFVMLSANGTMFEYLMPLLVMPTYDNTLLDHACKAAVKQQIACGKKLGKPWGISECCYSALDAHLHYQYKVFGLPELSMKHNHSGDDYVIAPYASALALLVNPGEACNNLEVLNAHGFTGRYGFFEAIDFTSSRMSGGQLYEPVRNYMTHHQGMIFLSIASALLGKKMQEHFVADPQLESTLILLQERLPNDPGLMLEQSGADLVKEVDPSLYETEGVKSVHTTDEEEQEVQILSNGRYHVLITNTGAGYSRWKDIEVTAWNENRKNNCSIFCDLREQDKTGWWPLQGNTRLQDKSKVTYSLGHALFERRMHDLETSMEIFVSPEEDVEIRRLTICNDSGAQKTLELVAYAEPALHHINLNKNDEQPYCKEVLQDQQAILCSMLPTADLARVPWIFFLVMVKKGTLLSVDYELTRTQRSDAAKEEVFGVYWDAFIAIRYTILLEPGEMLEADIFLGIEEDRESCERLLQRCKDPEMPVKQYSQCRSFDLAVLNRINATELDATLFRQLAGQVIFAKHTGPGDLVKKPGGISSKIPLIILRTRSTADIEVVEQLIKMHASWKLKGLAVSLLIWNEDDSCYRSFLQRLIIELIGSGIGAESFNRHGGGVFVKIMENLSDADIELISVATLVIDTARWAPGRDQINQPTIEKATLPELAQTGTIL